MNGQFFYFSIKSLHSSNCSPVTPMIQLRPHLYNFISIKMVWYYFNVEFYLPPDSCLIMSAELLPSLPLNFIPVSNQVYPSHVFKSIDLFKSGIRSNRALHITFPPFKIAPNRSVAQKSYLIQSQVQRGHCNCILPGMDQNGWQAHHFLFLGSDQFIDRWVLAASKNDLATIS